MRETIEEALKAISGGETDVAVALLESLRDEEGNGSVVWLLEQALAAGKSGDDETLREHVEAVQVALGSNGSAPVEEAVWTTEYVNNLPDSAFAFVEPGGKKDKDGKTMPRSLRHLPYRDADGKVDVPHLRAAMSRANQVKLRNGSTISSAQAKSLRAMLFKHLGGAKESDGEQEQTDPLAASAIHSGTVHESCSGDCPYDHADEIAESADSENIYEIFSGRIDEALEGPNAYRVTMIQAGMSRNRNYWPRNVLQASARLFEGAKAFADHPTQSERRERPERSVKDIIGWYESPQWAPTADGGSVKATLHLLEGPVADAVREAHARGKTDLIQLSVHISGKTMPKMIDRQMCREVMEIHRVHSVDAVTEASAGGSIDRLVASDASLSKEVQELMKLENITAEDLLAAVEARPELQQAMQEKYGTGGSQQESDADDADGQQQTDQTTQNAASIAAAAAQSDGDAAQQTQQTQAAAAAAAQQAEAQQTQQASVQESASSAERISQLTEAVEELHQQRLRDLSQTLVEGKLKASGLPEPIQERIRKRYAGQVIDEATIDAEITEERDILSKLSIGQPPSSVGWASQTDEAPADRWAKAMDGLLAGEAIDGVRPFGSLREAFYHISGGKSPFDYTGYEILAEAARYDSGVRNQNLTEATAMVTTNFAKVLGDSITRRALMEYRFPALQEWRNVASTSPVSDLREQKRERIGEFHLLRREASVSAGEGVTYADLTGQPLPEDEAIYQPLKADGQASLTIEMVINDDIGKFRNIPKMLGRAAAATIYVTVFDFLINNPAESTYLTGGGADRLFDTAANRSPGNLVTDVASTDSAIVALSDANLSDAKLRFDLVQAAVSSAPYSGARSHSFIMADPRRLIVAPKNRATATSLRDSDSKIATNTHEVNIHKGSFELMVVRYWEASAALVIGGNTLSPKNMWFLTADPNDIPMIEVGFLNGREDPEIFTQDMGTPLLGEQFTIDKITYKVRHFWGANPVDHRGMVAAHVVA